MKKLEYNYKQTRQASTLLSLCLSELEASEVLAERELFREAIVHMYFCSFYVSQALLAKYVGKKASHKNVESQLHKIYGKDKFFPRRYIDLHVFLHKIRNDFNYNFTHSPQPKLLQQKLRVLQAYVKFSFKVVPKLETVDILESIEAENPGLIQDFSYDIYCPRTYAHHTRLTLWQPPFYLRIFTVMQIQTQMRRALLNLRVMRPNEYVVGVNSRLDQYGGAHLIMLDIDTLDASVEQALGDIGGILLKSGRGFHFIGNTVISSQKEWERIMKKIKTSKDLRRYIDRNYIDISLRRGYATLRVTSNKLKPQVPVFYKEI